MVRKWEKKFSQNKNKLGRKEKSRSDLEEEIKKLKKQLKQSEKKLAKSELLIEIQKKISKMIQLDKKD
jgi:transposase-like protein